VSVAPAAYAFLPWLRRGVATAIARTDDDPGAATRVELPVTLAFNARSLTATAELPLAGPGEIGGLDHRAVARTWPRPGVTDAESNYFPLLEFERAQADLPWRYSPARATAKDRLRPWLCLIVLTETEIGQYQAASANRPLPIVTVRQASALPLPDLAQSWAWAHVQVSGIKTSEPAGTAELLRGQPQRLLSRLLCPRRLQPNTAYRAFVVPAFERGRLAGTGEPVPARLDGLAPAWSAGDKDVPLPVYFEWAFHTGAAGDFEYLVRLLVARALPATVGLRPMDVSSPGMGLPGAAPGPLGLEGALRAPSTVSTPWPPEQRAPWTAALADLLNLPDELVAAGTGERAVAPPLYGRWYAKRARLDPEARPPWFQDLNADPRLRVAAGLGTLVVQDQQQPLLAGAWQQVEGIVRLNEQLRWAQLAREAATSIYKRHVAVHDPEATLATTAPLHARIPIKGATLRAALRQSPIGEGALEPTFQRIARPLGPIGRRQGRADAPSRSGLLRRLNAGELAASRPPTLDRSHVATATQAAVGPGPLTPAKITNAIQRPGFVAEEGLPVTELGQPPVKLPDPLGRLDSTAARMFRRECAGLLQRVATPPAVPPQLRPVDLKDAAREVVKQLHPRKTIGEAYRKRLQLAPGVAWKPADPLEPVLVAPEFPQPMSVPLAALSPESLLAGLEEVPPNSVALLETNQAFVEAYIVGLNHEMSRELLWNEYPTNQQGTYFRQFWDSGRHMRSAGESPEAVTEIKPIHAWPANARLGANSGRPLKGRPNLVLLVRGELLRRYPNTLVYAVKAKRAEDGTREIDDSVPEKHPIFAGALAPDVTFFGFDLTEGQARGNRARGDEGWFFVLQEHTSEPRFGLDLATRPDPDPATRWDELAWEHLGPGISYIDLNAQLPDTRNVSDPGGPGAVWHADSGLGPTGTRASDLAYITLQRPVRVAVHASRMLPRREKQPQ
jgi:hypothetical protein